MGFEPMPINGPEPKSGALTTRPRFHELSHTDNHWLEWKTVYSSHQPSTRLRRGKMTIVSFGKRHSKAKRETTWKYFTFQIVRKLRSCFPQRFFYVARSERD